MTNQVLVAMSGGVDSSVAAALAIEAGWDVTGVHLKLADTPAHLQVPAGVSLRKVDLSTELQILSFHEQRRAAVDLVRQVAARNREADAGPEARD